jgi:hypothetical protein
MKKRKKVPRFEILCLQSEACLYLETGFLLLKDACIFMQK